MLIDSVVFDGGQRRFLLLLLADTLLMFESLEDRHRTASLLYCAHLRTLLSILCLSTLSQLASSLVGLGGIVHVVGQKTGLGVLLGSFLCTRLALLVQASVLLTLSKHSPHVWVRPVILEQLLALCCLVQRHVVARTARRVQRQVLLDAPATVPQFVEPVKNG